MSLLNVENLFVEFGTKKRSFRALDGFSLNINPGEIVGIAGESGCGKSVSMMAVMGLLEGQGRVKADQLTFDGQNLLALSTRERRKLIGKEIAMVFQDPMSALDPSYTVGFQLSEALKQHTSLRGAALRQRALELMESVEIPAPHTRLEAYPHQLSGGMSQRVMIAMAIACCPKLLIADEPSTALDVTIQAQIMKLLINLQQKHNMALILITHDLAVLAQMAQRMIVMYAGQVVEEGQIPTVFQHPYHPYTAALLAAIPKHSKKAKRLTTLPGIVPGQYDRPAGCLLSTRCPYVTNECTAKRPALLPQASGKVRCYYPL